MKTICFLFVASLTGCTIPGRTYHAIRFSAQRAKALPVEQFASAVVMREERTDNFDSALTDRVVVAARLPQETGSTTPTMPLPGQAQQIVESALMQGLHAKGYRAASRRNATALATEQSFPRGKLRGEDVDEWFKGSAMLVVTLNRFQAEPAMYQWYEGVWGKTISWPVGFHVHAHLTAEFFGARSSESLWTASARLDRVLCGTVSADAVLEDMVRLLVEKLPPSESAMKRTQP